MAENKKNILVFGAAGFIGTYLIDELISKGYKVHASDISEIGSEYYKQKNIPFTFIDIRKTADFESLSNLKFDAVIHLAAMQPANYDSKSNKPSDYIETNVNGTINILEYCVKNNVPKIIYASSHRNTSGLWKKGVPIKESDGRMQEYTGEYAMFSLSESAAQDCVLYYSNQYTIQGILFRLPPVYGYGPFLEIFKNGKPVKTGFQTFIDNAKTGKPIEIWGDKYVGRDIIYVKDVVNAFIPAIESGSASGMYNISSGYKLTLEEEIKTIAKVFSTANTTPQFVEHPDKKHFLDNFVYDNTKAQRELNWKPEYNFEQLLLDYKKESESNRFAYLIEKRKQLFLTHK